MRKLFVFAALFFLGALFLASPAYARGLAAEVEADYITALLGLVQQLATLAGVGAFIAALVNLCKMLGIIKDGQAKTFVVGFALLALNLLFVAHLVGISDAQIADWDIKLALAAKFITFVVSIIVQVVAADLTHVALSEKGVPVIGFSYSRSTQKKA